MSTHETSPDEELTLPTIGPTLIPESEDTDDEDHSPVSTIEIKNKILKNCFASMAARNG